MKRIILVTATFLLAATILSAQDTDVQSSNLEHIGSETQVDSSLLGLDIFDDLPSGIKVSQTDAVKRAVEKRIISNSSKLYSGYRIRIFFDSRRSARDESYAVMSRFNGMFPHIQAYRTYSSPNFKVTVGNFRTRVEAESLLEKLKYDFPEAFIVREKFKYPSIGDPDTTPASEADSTSILLL